MAAATSPPSPTSTRSLRIVQHADASPSSRAAAIGALTASLLERPTTKQRLLTRLMRSKDNRFQPFCQHLTRAECDAARRASKGRVSGGELSPCGNVHFVPDPSPQTDPSLGHCSYLSTCHRRKTCRYLHFRIERPHDLEASDACPFIWNAPYRPGSFRAQYASVLGPREALAQSGMEDWILATPSSAAPACKPKGHEDEVLFVNVPPELLALAQASPPAQWLHCDVRNFELGPVLGRGLWDVVLLDPPWDIHMSLPYGVLSDAQLLDLQLGQLQRPGGLLFIWVTGRAMDIARDCLAAWGYARIDEIVWIKTGHTQRLVRTGRTGHWINHSKEHCLVAIKLDHQEDSDVKAVAPEHSASEGEQHQGGLVRKDETFASDGTREGLYETGGADSSDATRESEALARSTSSSTLPAVPGGRPRPALPPGTLPSEGVPRWALRGLSADALVSEVRDTSRKPDELYGIIERLVPGGHKLELFGRRHNLRPGWLTLGNQIRSTHVLDTGLAGRLRRAGVGGVEEE